MFVDMVFVLTVFCTPSRFVAILFPWFHFNRCLQVFVVSNLIDFLVFTVPFQSILYLERIYFKENYSPLPNPEEFQIKQNSIGFLHGFARQYWFDFVSSFFKKIEHKSVYLRKYDAFALVKWHIVSSSHLLQLLT